MQIVLLTTGHRGDVQPLVALGHGLAGAGHAVAVASPAAYADLVRAHGLEHRSLPDDPMLVRHAAPASGRRERRRASEALSQELVALLEACWQAAKGADLLIAHPKTVAGPHLAQGLQIPLIVAAVTPSVTPTTDFANPDGPALPLGGWYNALSYRFPALLSAPMASAIREWRGRRLGSAAGIGRLRWPRKHEVPVLYAFSPLVVPRPRDWPASTVVTGYWPLGAPAGWKPEPGLAEFVQEEPAPVYIGFGSAPIDDPRHFFEGLSTACRNEGLRVLIDTSDSAVEIPSGGGILPVRDVPHAWLFAHARAVVHHGGAGTTGAGLVAGCPTVVCPFAGDQFFWARMVRDLGVGPDFEPARTLSPDALVAAIAKATTQSAILRSCQVLAEELAEEDGIGNAIRFIEQTARR